MLGISCQDFDILLNFVLVYTPFKEKKRAQVNIWFLTREVCACARASSRYDVGNGIRSLARSLDWSIPVNFF